MRVIPTVLALSLALVVGGDLHAQEASTPVLEHELRMMVVEPLDVDADRQVLRDFLNRDDVRNAVTEAGLDADRLEARVSMLENESLADVANHVRDLEEEGDLVGGNTIVISGSTLIIVLLVLILVT